jgi:hypothetical protein
MMGDAEKRLWTGITVAIVVYVFLTAVGWP